MTEQELVALCKSGDRSALKMLYERYATWMMGISMRYTGNEEDSRDILHDSFLKVFGSMQRFEYRGVGSLGAWLSRIVVNTALARLKSENNFTSLDNENLKDDLKDEQEPVKDLYDKVSDEVIILCVGKLPARLRVVFNLFMFEDASHTEIAGKLGIAESASRVRLHRAKQLLAEEIKEYINKTEQ